MRSREILRLPRAVPNRMLILAALVCTLPSCGGSGGGSNFKAADPPPAAQLTANPARIDFGTVTLGSNSSQAVTLRNSGTTGVTVSQANLTGTAFSVSGLGLPLTLQGNQTTVFSVTFAPQATGNASGSASIVSDAGNSPTSVSFTGNGATASSHSVSLTWDASTSAVVGYNVYRGTASGGPYTKLNSAVVASNSYTDSNVQAGQAYFYVATAVDTNSVESLFSNEAQASVPSA